VSTLTGVVIALAATRVTVGLAYFLSGQVVRTSPEPLPLEAFATLAVTFGIVGSTLITTNRHDQRALWLGSVFMLVASMLCTPFLVRLPDVYFKWLIRVRPDALLPYFLWRFVAAFPSPLVGRAAQAAKAMAGVTLAVGLVLLAMNLSYLVKAPLFGGSDWRTPFTPMSGQGRPYVLLVFGLSAIAIPALVLRAVVMEGEGRRRLLLFCGGLMAGALPLTISVTLEAIPEYYAFTHAPGVEPWVGAFLFGALATVPFLTTYSVLFDHIVNVRVVLRTALQYALARYTIFAVTMVLFGALVAVVLTQRPDSLAAMMTGPRPLLLAGSAVAGLVALRLHRRWLDALDRRFFREAYDARLVLDGMLSHALRVTDGKDLAARLRGVLERAFHADAALFLPNETRSVFHRADNGLDPVAADGVLMGLARADPSPMDVDPADSRSPFRRLPADEQRWLVTTGARLLLPLGTERRMLGLLALSAKQSGLPYSDEDRRLLSALGASASLALDNLRLRSSTPEPSSAPPALECGTCSRVNAPTARACECGGSLMPASAPHVLRGVFRLDRRIGAGGMGVVYHAVDLELGRSVAIKTLPRVGPEHVERLRREARAMAVVTHPNLAVIHSFETWQGIPFLVEEFLAGGTLSDRLRSGPLPVDESLELGGTLASVLDRLHRAGVIHRDVKPSNIGFTDAGVAKMLDLGLARLASTAAVAADTTTRGGGRHSWSSAAVVGTPPYMSPEALTGQKPSPAFDLWSLSIVIYQCLTGRYPFEGRNVDEIAASIASRAATPPSVLRDGCPPPLDQFFDRALATDPSRRHPDAMNLLQELRGLRQKYG
jgi:hypothetical protein